MSTNKVAEWLSGFSRQQYMVFGTFAVSLGTIWSNLTWAEAAELKNVAAVLVQIGAAITLANSEKKE